MRRLLSLSAVAVMLCLASAAFAEEATTATVKGSVVDADGKAVAGATVKLFAAPLPATAPAKTAKNNGEKPTALKTATTDADGKFEIKDVAAGRYRIEVASPVGNGKTKEPFTVDAGKDLTVDPITVAPKANKKG